MIKRIATIAFLLSVASLVAIAPAYGHHSFAAGYFENQVKRIEGTIAIFFFRNPHSWLHVDVEEDGQVVRYSVEWGAGLQLNRQGVSRETLKAGDHVIITGNPGRIPADHRLRMRSIERPKDGWKWGGTFD